MGTSTIETIGGIPISTFAITSNPQWTPHELSILADFVSTSDSLQRLITRTAASHTTRIPISARELTKLEVPYDVLEELGLEGYEEVKNKKGESVMQAVEAKLKRAVWKVVNAQLDDLLESEAEGKGKGKGKAKAKMEDTDEEDVYEDADEVSNSGMDMDSIPVTKPSNSRHATAASNSRNNTKTNTTVDRKITLKTSREPASTQARAPAPTRQTKSKDKHNVISLSGVGSAFAAAELAKTEAEFRTVDAQLVGLESLEGLMKKMKLKNGRTVVEESEDEVEIL